MLIWTEFFWNSDLVIKSKYLWFFTLRAKHSVMLNKDFLVNERSACIGFWKQCSLLFKRDSNPGLRILNCQLSRQGKLVLNSKNIIWFFTFSLHIARRVSQPCVTWLRTLWVKTQVRWKGEWKKKTQRQAGFKPIITRLLGWLSNHFATTTALY